MSTTTIGFQAMPGCISKDAPSFSGHVKNLQDFFMQFEDLADSCGLTSAEQCHAVLQYINSNTKELWASFPEFEKSDFDVLKTSIIDEYPEADLGAQYTHHNLENIVICYVDQDISLETEFVEYSHRFCPVAAWLVKNKISEWECDKLFWQEIPCLFQQEIMMQLQISNPKGFDYTAYLDFEKIIWAGHAVLHHDRFNAASNDLVAVHIKAAHNTSAAAPSNSRTTNLCDYENTNQYHQTDNMQQEVQMTTVHFDAKASIDKTPSSEVEDLAHRMYNMNIDNAVYAGYYVQLVYLNPSTAQFIVALAKYWTNHPAPIQQTYTTSSASSPASQLLLSSCCYMCSGPHFLGQCLVIEDYIYAGRIVCTLDTCLAFPDGSHLICYHGTGLFRTIIDEHFGSSLPVQSSTPTSVPNTSKFSHDPPAHTTFTTYSIAEPDLASFVFQCVLITKNNAVIIDADKDVEVYALE